MKQYYINDINDEEVKFHSLNLLFSEFVIVKQDDKDEDRNIKCTYYDSNKFRTFAFYKQISRSICDFSYMKIYE